MPILKRLTYVTPIRNVAFRRRQIFAWITRRSREFHLVSSYARLQSTQERLPSFRKYSSLETQRELCLKTVQGKVTASRSMTSKTTAHQNFSVFTPKTAPNGSDRIEKSQRSCGGFTMQLLSIHNGMERMVDVRREC